MSKYPYPVLCNEESSYRDEIKFDLEYINNYRSDDTITFEFNVKLNSTVIKDLILSGKARMIIRVQTGIFATSYNVDTMNEKQSCNLKISNIRSNDEITFVAYVVAVQKMTYYASQELIDLYDEDYQVELEKNSVLAISNTESLSYSTSNNDFIQYEVSKEMSGKGYKIRYETNYIYVTVGPEFNQAYGVIKNNYKNVCSVFDAHLVFEVMVYTLFVLIQQYEDYCESDWYGLFEQLFLQCGKYKTFEKFIEEARDNDLINAELVYEMAHLLVNNQIENSIVTLSRNNEEG